MSDKKSILVKAILDKTGITKGIKEIQTLLDRIRLPLHTKFDTSEAEKQLQAAVKRAGKQPSPKKPLQKMDSVPTGTDKAKSDSSSSSPPRTRSSKESGSLIRLFLTGQYFSFPSYRRV